MKKRAILFANGQVTEREVSIARGIGFDLVVAADGGIVNAERFDLVPNIVVGDFDSLPENSRTLFPEIHFVHRPSQDQCDLEKALIHCEKEQITAITLLGATGKRPDHTLGNLSLLTRYDRHFQIRTLTPEAEVFIVRDHLELEGMPGQGVSLVPIGEARLVTTTGLKYPLTGETLAFGKREGTSNEFSSHRCSVSLESGLLIVFHLYPEI
ncbi:MAG: thiamine diphosphokinase [Acidobacteria bacterium CG_4_9_14_3_um_filter_49_7]|nr:MAG: thiamine diphosphokinase [Acidobacteria bacterium CG_4_9_14_3_um_filter_49_7]